eukprot:g11771.t1
MPKVQSFQSAVPDGAVADDEQDEFEKELLEELEEHKALEQARNNWTAAGQQGLGLSKLSLFAECPIAAFHWVGGEAVLATEYQRICPGADASQVKKMGDLLKRELTMRSAETSSEAHNGPRRQPLYTTPNAAGSKSMAKDTLSSSKLESSLVPRR